MQKEAFTASLGAGDKVNYNLGIVNIIQGDYQAAINYFGSSPSYNLALAKYLNGDAEGAWRTLADVEESPYRSYLLAVIAASQDKTDEVYENLEKAALTSKDPQYMKDHAKTDLEFAKLWNEPEFKAIVE